MLIQRKPIPGYEGYEVDNLGNVFTFWKKRGGCLKGGFDYVIGNSPRKLTPDDNGWHLRVTLWKKGKSKRLMVHAIVLKAFVGERPEGFHIRHLDGDYMNNKVENLCYGTPKENAEDTKRHKTNVMSSFVAHHGEQVLELLEEGYTQKSIALAFGVGKSIVGRIKRGEVMKEGGTLIGKPHFNFTFASLQRPRSRPKNNI